MHTPLVLALFSTFLHSTLPRCFCEHHIWLCCNWLPICQASTHCIIKIGIVDFHLPLYHQRPTASCAILINAFLPFTKSCSAGRARGQLLPSRTLIYLNTYIYIQNTTICFTVFCYERQINELFYEAFASYQKS